MLYMKRMFCLKTILSLKFDLNLILKGERLKKFDETTFKDRENIKQNFFVCVCAFVWRNSDFFFLILTSLINKLLKQLLEAIQNRKH